MIKNTITDLDGNLRRNRITEDVVLLKDEAALKQHINLLLLCSTYSSIGRPFLCAGLREFLAEPAHDGTIEEVKARIKNTLKYETRVRPIEIIVKWDDEVKYLTIEIDFEYVNADKSFTYTTRLRRVS